MSRGHNRERQVRKRLEEEGWVVVRAAGSLGDIDLVACRANHPVRFIEVKSDDSKYGPFNNFKPKDRAEFLEAAGKAGAVPELIYWPPYGAMEVIPTSLWPGMEGLTTSETSI